MKHWAPPTVITRGPEPTATSLSGPGTRGGAMLSAPSIRSANQLRRALTPHPAPYPASGRPHAPPPPPTRPMQNQCLTEPDTKRSIEGSDRIPQIPRRDLGSRITAGIIVTGVSNRPLGHGGIYPPPLIPSAQLRKPDTRNGGNVRNTVKTSTSQPAHRPPTKNTPQTRAFRHPIPASNVTVQVAPSPLEAKPDGRAQFQHPRISAAACLGGSRRPDEASRSASGTQGVGRRPRRICQFLHSQTELSRRLRAIRTNLTAVALVSGHRGIRVPVAST